MRRILAWVLVMCCSMGPVWAEDDYLDRSIRYQDWIIGPQPGPADLDALSAAGVGQIVSLRRPVEHAELPFDQWAAMDELGMSFALIPAGGDDYPHSPARLDAFAELIETLDGPVLLHCRSGARAASYLAAYLISRQGMDRDTVLERLAGMTVREGIVDALLAPPDRP